MRYFLDTEFNSFGGAMISLALVGWDIRRSLYLVEVPERIDGMKLLDGMDPWIEKNVVANLYYVPEEVEITICPAAEWGAAISSFLAPDDHPQIFADWPSDIMDLCRLLMLPDKPGHTVPMHHITHMSILRHIDVYPPDGSPPDFSLYGEQPVRHNAWWDAVMLRQWLVENEA